MLSVSLHDLRERGMIDPVAEAEFIKAPDNVKALLARWAIWYCKRIEVGSVNEILKNEVTAKHADQARAMFATWTDPEPKPPRLHLVLPDKRREPKGA